MRAALLIATLCLVWPRDGAACDSYSSRKLIGFSQDGNVVASRVSGSRPGYLSRYGTYLIFTRPGACAEPAMLVVPVERLKK